MSTLLERPGLATTHYKAPPVENGGFRSEGYPGSWLDPQALLRRGSCAVRAALEQGVVTGKRAQFVRRLASAREQKG